MIDVARIDKHLAFLMAEKERLDRMRETWAVNRAQRYQELIDDLKSVRREMQMTTMSGRRIE